MSDTRLPTPDEANAAFHYIAEQIYGPVFFDKLAEFGICGQNDAQCEQLLRLGATLTAAEQQGLYKSAQTQANETNSPFLSHVLGRLEGALAPHMAAPAPQEGQIKQGALQLVLKDELTKQAALVYDYILRGGQVAEAPAEAA
jgi:hypothetical protein